MPGGVGRAVQAAKFAGGLGVAAARAGWCPPGGAFHHKDGGSVYRFGCALLGMDATVKQR